MHCRGLHSLTNPAYIEGFPFSGLHSVALPVVSEWCQRVSGIWALTFLGCRPTWVSDLKRANMRAVASRFQLRWSRSYEMHPLNARASPR
jgi:hypothetical protein